MKRLTSHETRYNHSPNEKQFKSRNYKYLKSKGRRQVQSEESSQKDDSSQRYTDESDDTVRGRRPRHRMDTEWSTMNRNHYLKKINDKRDDARVILCQPCYCDARTSKKNKKTQKNLISPTPSYLPPTPRKGLISQIRSKMPAKLNRVKEDSSPSTMTRFPPKCSEREEDVLCFHHHQHHHGQGHSHTSEAVDYNRNCCPSVDSPDGTIGQSSNEVEIYWKKSCEGSGDIKDRQPQQQQNFFKNDVKTDECQMCSEVDLDLNKISLKSCGSEKQLIVHDSFPMKVSAEGTSKLKSVSGGNVKAKEKLVYVVEEDGNDTTKMETDLFTVNEILTIKKDLLELSEFAKKLKKLKEMKKESDRMKKDGKPCTCKPVTELLGDVNRRIAALEVRQEELESGKSSKKDNCQSNFKNLYLKTPTESCAKTAGPNNPSENPVVSKPELIALKAEEFPNNSEIVCELMDIKTQLQKLEKRKMLMDDPVQEVPSRTYILASPNNLRGGKLGKKNASKSASNKPENATDLIDVIVGNSSRPEGKILKSKTEKTNENVSNWLKNVPSESNNEFGVFAASEMRNAKLKEVLIGQPSKCRKCRNELKSDDYEIQEQQKNRVSGNRTDTNHEESSRNVQGGDSCIAEMGSHFECRECLLTNSGRFLDFDRKSSSKRNGSAIKSNESPEMVVTSTILSLLRRSTSSFSVPSAAITQDHSSRFCNTKDSKSMHELSSVVAQDETEKITRNTTLHSLNAKRSKDTKNEMVKKSGVAHLESSGKKDLEKGDAPPVSRSSHSYLLADINLDEGKKLQNSSQNKSKESAYTTQVFSTTAVCNSTFEADECISPKMQKACEKNAEKAKKQIKKLHKKHEKDCKKQVGEACSCKLAKKREKKEKKELKKCKKKEKKCDKLAKKNKKNCEKLMECKQASLGSLSCSVSSVEMLYNEMNQRRTRGDQHLQPKIGNSKNKHCKCCSTRAQFKDNECAPALPNTCSGYSFQAYKNRCQQKSEPPSGTVKCSMQPQSSALPACSVEEKQKEACGLSNFFRNLRSLYPRCSYLKFFPAFKLQCDKSVNDQQCQMDGLENLSENKGSCLEDKSKRRVHYVSHDCERKNCETCNLQPLKVCHCHMCGNSGNYANCKCYKVYLETHVRDPKSRRKPDEETESTNDRSYGSIQNEEDKKFHGDDSEGSYSYDEISRRIKPDSGFLFPYRKSQVYYVGHSSEEKKCMKKLAKYEKEMKKKEKRRKKEEKKEMDKLIKKCTCLICGDTHNRKKCEKKKKHKKNEVSYEDEHCFEHKCKRSVCNCKEPKKKKKLCSICNEDPCECASIIEALSKGNTCTCDTCADEQPKKHKGKEKHKHKSHNSGHRRHCPRDTPRRNPCKKINPCPSVGTCHTHPDSGKVQIFSFLKNFCSGRLKPNKNPCYSSKASLIKKIKEVRCMQVCQDRSKPCFKNCLQPPGNNALPYSTASICSCLSKNISDDSCGRCHCGPILEEINDRITHLEDRDKSTESCCNKVKKSPKKKECENYNPRCIGCRNEEREKEIKKRNKKIKKECKKECKKRNKKNKKKCDEDCSACASETDMADAIGAYHFTINPKFKNASTSNSTEQTLTTTGTTEATTTTATTTTTTNTTGSTYKTNKSESSSNEGSQKFPKRLTEGLAGISSFWRHFTKCSRPEPVHNFHTNQKLNNLLVEDENNSALKVREIRVASPTPSPVPIFQRLTSKKKVESD